MKKYFAAGILTVCIISAGIINYANAASAEPGSSLDPIVSKSYVDTQISELKKLINNLEEDLQDLNDNIKDLNSDVRQLKKQENSSSSNETSDNNSSSNSISTQQLTSEVVEVIDKLYADKFAMLEEIAGNAEEEKQESFEPVLLLAGQILLGGEGAEIVPRSGVSVAYSENSMGLIDVTSGEELYMGTALSANHLLLVARSDGRGVYAQTDSWFIVKGGYIIK